MHLIHAAAEVGVPVVRIPFMISSEVMFEARQAILRNDRIADIAPIQCTGVAAITKRLITLSSIP